VGRKLPPFRLGQYYHLYNRGAHRQPIFLETDNYLFVLSKIKGYITELSLTIIAYCLMPNHYHLFVRQDGEERAGKLAQLVFNSYVKAYNKRYHHSGTLFEGPYNARIIDNESYLLHLCRYIHANPVKDGLVEKLEEWPYSNYLEWIGRRAGTLVNNEFIFDYFQTPGEYEAFVQDYLLYRQLPEGLVYLEE